MSTSLPVDTALDVVLASNADEATAVDAVRAQHAELAGRLAVHADALLRAATAGNGGGFEAVRTAAARFCSGELLPSVTATETALYPAAAASDRLRLLVEVLRAQQRRLAELIAELVTAEEPVRAAAAGHALRALLGAHLAAEDDLLLPAAAADPALSLASLPALLAGMPAPAEVPSRPEGHDHGSCGCGGQDDEIPVLDAREVPHAIRHATVFGAFDAVPVGGSLVLIAPHDPLPLLRQLDKRVGGGLAVDYEERGPQAWRLRLTRV